MTQSAQASLSTEDLLRQLRWRYAVKKFDATRKISPKLWEALEDALILSPSSFGLQPWKFFVVQNDSLRQKLQPVAWNQSQITEASHLVVFAVRKELNVKMVRDFIALTAEVRQASVESLAPYQALMENFITQRPQDLLPWASRQVYIALGNFLTSAALLGVDACPMEGFDPQKFDEILGLKEKGYGSLVLATAGYRSPEDKYAQAPKVRSPKKQMIEYL